MHYRISSLVVLVANVNVSVVCVWFVGGKLRLQNVMYSAFFLIENQLINAKNKMNIQEVELSYMGKKCTIYDYINYNKDISKCKELEKIGALVYIDSIVKRIDIEEMCFDTILEYLQSNFDECNHLAIKIINDYKITEIPDFTKELLESKSEDLKYDLFVKFLKYCGVS